MTVSSSTAAAKMPAARPSQSSSTQQNQQQAVASCSVPSSSSAAFQQVKQTQASLARLSRAQQQQQQFANQSSHQAVNKPESSGQVQQQPKSTTFVDCLIRRFKDCFSEDACTVPMFVVGNLSPGSDGTHLILPPCVSLGRQNINRFTGPKSLRLMNSIRESCRSIEELDLGGNKLNDLIEVYKILQCTPNLRFLNLSENDLSRASPVAMAASTTLTSSSSATVTTIAPLTPGNMPVSATTPSVHHHHLSAANSIAQLSYGRNCLAPIVQNQQQAAMGSRRHSSLGQSTIGNQRVRPAASRVAEARRLAAAAAVAQSKKTSSSVASKLTSSATNGNNSSRVTSSAKNLVLNREGAGKLAESGRLRPPASTMHLARSLSSLSAKDVRAVNSISRLSAQRSSCRREVGDLKSQKHKEESNEDLCTGKQAGKIQTSDQGKLTGSSKLFVEPIVEAVDDIDMSEQHASSAAVATSNISTTSNQQHQITQTRASPNQTNHGVMSRLSMSSSSSPNFRRTFGSIKALALNNTGCQWRVVCSILSRMPNLEELHLSLNNYERIDLDPNEFKHRAIKRLYLCNNPKLTNWEELDKLLVAFPSLEALSIADCSISQIPDNLDRAREWRKLCGLNINGWPIKEWPVIERLNQLPSLIDLKCRNLEILNTIDEPRHHLIARLPKLQRLNGSEIEEREHAEKAFLRFFMTNSHLERPTRFHELVQIHGEVAPVDVDVDLSPPSQAQVRVIYLNRNHYRKENEDDVLMSEDFLIKLMDTVDPSLPGSQNLDNMDLSDHIDGDKTIRLFKDEGQEVLAIEIDLRQSVRKFKTTLAELFGLQSQNLILYYIDREMVGLMGPELIKHNQKKLWNYNVQDGDQFIVEER